MTSQMTGDEASGDIRVRTYSGRRVSLTNPNPSDICILDIAHALSQMCRWNGHTNTFYSVADHSLRVMYKLRDENAPPHFQLLGLLHDGAEAYMGDISRPVRKALGPIVDELDKRLTAVILQKYCGTSEIPPSVWDVDDYLMGQEARELMGWEVWPERTFEHTTFGRLDMKKINEDFLVAFAKLV